MKIDRKTNSEIRANKEKLVMENFASIMKKLDATFLIESKEEKVKINEEDNSLRAQLHTLVGNEMKSGKRADMYGAHHVEEHEKAERELENFLQQNPQMLDFVEEVEEYFMKRLNN